MKDDVQLVETLQYGELFSTYTYYISIFSDFRIIFMLGASTISSLLIYIGKT